MAANKMVKEPYRENAYEVWETFGWRWYVLKKYHSTDDKPDSRWFCLVESPFMPNGELGDVYAREVIEVARRVR